MLPMPPPTRPLTPLRSPGQIPAAMDGTDPERRRKILADPEVHEAIRAVARLRGVSSDQVGDILGEVCADALEDAKLPLEDARQARLYLCGMARFKAIDLARQRERNLDFQEVQKSQAAGEALGDPEDTVHAWRLVDWGKKTFPRTFEWFLRHAVHGETHQAIAADAKVSSDHVRHTVASIRLRMNAQMATLGVAVLLALVFGIYRWRTPGQYAAGPGRDLARTAATASTTPPVPPVPPSAAPPTPAESAAALRERARKELDEGEWEECELDLQEARRLDPAGETPAHKHLYRQCENKLLELEAKPR